MTSQAGHGHILFRFPRPPHLLDLTGLLHLVQERSLCTIEELVEEVDAPTDDARRRVLVEHHHALQAAGLGIQHVRIRRFDGKCQVESVRQGAERDGQVRRLPLFAEHHNGVTASRLDEPTLDDAHGEAPLLRLLVPLVEGVCLDSWVQAAIAEELQIHLRADLLTVSRHVRHK